jgi:recombinational DNA repair protein RecT
MVKLLTDTGSVKNVYSHVVYEGDEFEVELGTETKIVHKPQFKTKTIEKVYAVAILHDGVRQIEVMTKQETDAIKGISESYKAFLAGKISSCIWVDNESEMCRKTVIKRISKYLPKTDRWEKFSQAVEIDNQDYLVSDDQRYYLLNLLESTMLESEVAKMLEHKIKGELSLSEFNSIKKQLTENQLDPITAGGNYNQTDIKNHLAKLK